jgi:tRNA 2-thiouridine synthesizing protein E
MPAHLDTPTAPLGRPLPALFDGAGFLEDGERGTPALAEQIAADEGVAVLGDKHWAVIGLVRERFFAIGSLPVMRLICRAAGIEPGRGHQLFPSCRSLWRIAGLPDPGEEAKAYMN